MIGRIIALLIVGLIVGALGRLLHPGRDPMPVWLTVIIGVVAAIVAGVLLPGIFGFILAVVIAAALVALVARFGRTSTRRI